MFADEKKTNYDFPSFFSSSSRAPLKTSMIFVNDSWPNSEVEPADIVLPDALSSLTICFVGKKRRRFFTFICFSVLSRVRYLALIAL